MMTQSSNSTLGKRPFTDCMKSLFHGLFDHILFFCGTNLLWFLTSIFLPAKLIASNHTYLGIMCFIIFSPPASAAHYLLTAKRISFIGETSLGKFFFKTWIVSLIHTLLLLLFAFNNFFYYSTFSNGITLLNSFFFFFTFWLFLMLQGLIIFWVPLSLREKSLILTLKKGFLSCFIDLRSYFIVDIVFLIFAFISFIFLFFIFMPVKSLLIFNLFAYFSDKNKDSFSKIR